ncbi:MAG: 5-formyltetrahydrofolate cyclo-ligase [Methanocellales archaeon]|nr:5-formyltetrahydrofolate cyclo-ligase [Methanocellales archaeon]
MRCGSVSLDKARIREHIWDEMERCDVARFPPPHGRIPNFVDAEKAAELVSKQNFYQDATMIFVTPDSPQRPVRETVLRDGKLLLIASPRMKSGFILISPEDGDPREASSIGGALMMGRSVDLTSVEVDLLVTGAVAVDRAGRRLGKGTGYFDQEYVALLNSGAIDDGTLVACTVHPIQIVDEVPSEEHDIRVDYIITPGEVIRTRRHRVKR